MTGELYESVNITKGGNVMYSCINELPEVVARGRVPVLAATELGKVDSSPDMTSGPLID